MRKDFRRLRTTFNKSADWYDQIRPGYPEELINDVISLSAIPEGGKAYHIILGLAGVGICWFLNYWNLIGIA